MVEPWITLPSWILYRFFHHEACRLTVDVTRPFASKAQSPAKAMRRFPISPSRASAMPACPSTS